MAADQDIISTAYLGQILCTGMNIQHTHLQHRMGIHRLQKHSFPVWDLLKWTNGTTLTTRPLLSN